MASINLDLAIIPGKGIGDISLGQSIHEITSELQYESDYSVTMFPQNPIPVMFYTLAGGVLEVTCDMDGIITAVFCSSPYKGLMYEKYYPGMTVRNFQDLTPSHRFIHGYLMIGKEKGGGFVIPDGYEYYDYLNQFPDDFELDKMFVMDSNWLTH